MIYRELQAFSLSFDLAPLPSSPSPHLPSEKFDRRHTGRLRKRKNLQTEKRGGGQIARPQESLVLYKSFNTLCSLYFSHLLAGTGGWEGDKCFPVRYIPAAGGGSTARACVPFLCTCFLDLVDLISIVSYCHNLILYFTWPEYIIIVCLARHFILFPLFRPDSFRFLPIEKSPVRFLPVNTDGVQSTFLFRQDGTLIAHAAVDNGKSCLSFVPLVQMRSALK